MTLAIFPASGTASAPSATGTATPASASTDALMNWSAPIGHVSIATPAAVASSTEFHPQCVRNHPTARWRRISTCGAHPRIAMPRDAAVAAASNPSGTTVPLLTAQTKATEPALERRPRTPPAPVTAPAATRSRRTRRSRRRTRPTTRSPSPGPSLASRHVRRSCARRPTARPPRTPTSPSGRGAGAPRRPPRASRTSLPRSTSSLYSIGRSAGSSLTPRRRAHAP
uniref:Uncharacterized protein n=1 Tax=Triticum urartu TaxID=4572 RepID=A0A8R7PBG0_TRIUA